MGLKSDFITALRNTPEGIDEFTTRAIPNLPVVEWPEDVDAAIIAQGQLAANINLLLNTFEGLTIVELLLRIGQHSNVTEAILLGILEYINASGGENTIEVQHPEAEAIYLPGDLQIIVKALTGTPKDIAAIVAATAIPLDRQEEFWVGTISMPSSGEYTLQVEAEYVEGDPVTASVNFSISETPDDNPKPPGGDDKEAVSKAKDNVDQAYRDFIKTISATANREDLIAKYQIWKSKIQTYLATTKAASPTPFIYDRVPDLLKNSAFVRMSTEIQKFSEGTTETHTLLEVAAGLQSVVDYIQGLSASI